ncbi:uncharacterized protein LOC18432466 [Amborella trichopoda]|uniref:Large ribosomal subunit protein bL17c n=1 Tax=Amborella trichopoda TaxID=13333 RepID=W1P9M2_AMBTC|nr:uncharacterized protein LOC18432466 [Amborella trichopoda]ERN04306.1 hypothetical protein AMTR_s00077p00185050 [Amborella trichopoda]|eukprot:XP_006842631.1 uncharacterized protein LOC18432466 [Amborella trichopoda]
MAATGLATWSMASLRSALPPTPVARKFPATGSYFPVIKTTRRKTPGISRSFSGLAIANPLPINTDCIDVDHRISLIDNGGRFYAMRHGRRVPKLNRPPDQRRALLRGLTTQLLKHGRIKTTRARASAMRKYVDKMITLAKDGSLHKRRQALGFIYEKEIVHALFAEVQDRYGERNGGYTRIIRTLPRRGDNAPMAYIELV